MQRFLERAGILLGHTICILVLVYCFVTTKEEIPETPTKVHTVTVPSVTDTVMPAATQTPAPAELSAAPQTPAPQTPIPTEPSEAAETPTPKVESMPSPTAEPTVIPVTERALVKQYVQKNIASGVYSQISNEGDDWWFRRNENHKPSGSGELFDISEYKGVYLNSEATEEDKVVYLTIDCGYGSDNTEVFLDIFKEEKVQVTFFVTNYFLKANPKEVRRMSEEGHAVGNHSVSHPDLTTLTEEEIYSEVTGCEEAYYNLTGKQMDLFFRPPGGDYSRKTMQIIKDLGYHSVFWSFAYFDYDQNNQPGREYVIDHFKQYHHNGAIILMHNDSVSNRDAVREVIHYLKEQGYRFGSLDEFCK